MPELHDLSALDQAGAIRHRDVSPVELMRHYLERIERLSDAVGAFVTVTGEAALEPTRTRLGCRRRPDAVGEPADQRFSCSLAYPVFLK